MASIVAALAFAWAPVHVAYAAYYPHVAHVQWIPPDPRLAMLTVEMRGSNSGRPATSSAITIRER